MIDLNGTYLDPDMLVVWRRSDFTGSGNPAAPECYVGSFAIVGDQLYVANVHYGADGSDAEAADPDLTLLWNAGPVADPLLNTEDWTLVAQLAGYAIEGQFVSDRTRTAVWFEADAFVVTVATGASMHVVFPVDTPEPADWSHGSGTGLDGEDAVGFRYEIGGAEPLPGIRDLLTFNGVCLLDRPVDVDGEGASLLVTSGYPGYIVADQPMMKSTNPNTLVIRSSPSDIPAALASYHLGEAFTPTEGIINYYFQNNSPPDAAPPLEFWGIDPGNEPNFHWVIDPEYAEELIARGEGGGTLSFRLYVRNMVGGSTPVTAAEDDTQFYLGEDPEGRSALANMYNDAYLDPPYSADLARLYFFPAITVHPNIGPEFGVSDVDYTKFGAWISGQYYLVAANWASSRYVFHSVALGGDTEISTFQAGVEIEARTDYRVDGAAWWSCQTAFDDQNVDGQIYTLTMHHEPIAPVPTGAITGAVTETRARFSG